MPIAAAICYALLTLGVVGFQLALASGVPWGAYAMGGRFPGRFPVGLRIAAGIQALILSGLAWILLVRTGVLPGSLPAGLGWLVVGVSALASVLNAATPSPAERRIWLPVALLMLISSLLAVLFS